VGTNINDWMNFLLTSNFSSVGIENAPVLPVPFFALAIRDFPANANGIASSCIGDGFSYPISYIPIWSSLFNTMSSNDMSF